MESFFVFFVIFAEHHVMRFKGSKVQRFKSSRDQKIKNMAKVKSFEDLLILQMAREINRQIYTYTRREDFRYDTRFVQQIRAAAGSIMDNIAEGFERTGNKEFRNFLYISKGSCGEVRSQLVRAFDAGYLTKEEYDYIYIETKKLGASIMKFIVALQDSEYKGAKYASEDLEPLNH